MSKRISIVSLLTLLLPVVWAITSTQSSLTVARLYGDEGEKMVGGLAVEAQADELTPRGVWVWGEDVVTDPTAQSIFLTFTQSKDLTEAYLNAYSLLPNKANQIKDFIVRAKTTGTEVELLAGDPTWALTPNHPVALGFVQQVITFTESITGGAARPVAVHLDIEPYVLAEWGSSQDAIITQYLDLLNGVKQELAASTAPLTLTVDIPFWFDTITTTYKNASKPLNQHVQDIVDRIVIMDYRDFAEGSDGIIDHAQNEVNYAQSIPKEVVIGVETNKVEPEKITFFEEGEATMETELALVKQYYQVSPAFHGFAIHDYAGYWALCSEYVYLPIILK